MKLNIQLFALMPKEIRVKMIKDAIKCDMYNDVPDTAIYTIREDLEFIKELNPPIYIKNKVILNKIQKIIITLKLKKIINKRLKQFSIPIEILLEMTSKEVKKLKEDKKKARRYIEEELYEVGGCVHGSDLPYDAAIKPLLEILGDKENV